jgi:hypothetical protein
MERKNGWRVWITVGCTLALLVAAGRVTAAGPEDFLKLAPAGHEALIYVDVAQALKSKVWQDVKNDVLNPQAQANLAAIEQLTGMRVPDDIETVAASGKVAVNNEGCLYLRAKWDRQRVESFLAMNPMYTEIDRPGGKILGYHDENKGQMNYISFLKENLAVLGQKEAIITCLDTVAGEKKSLAENPKIKALLAGQPENAVVLVLAVHPQAPPPDMMKIPSIENLQSGLFALTSTPEFVTAIARLEADSAEMAKKWADIARGLIALGQIQQNVPQLAEIANMASASQKGTAVEMKVQVASARASELLRKQIAKKRGRPANAGPAGVPPAKAADPQW